MLSSRRAMKTMSRMSLRDCRPSLSHASTPTSRKASNNPIFSARDAAESLAHGHSGGHGQSGDASPSHGHPARAQAWTPHVRRGRPTDGLRSDLRWTFIARDGFALTCPLHDVTPQATPLMQIVFK
ncbi:hypothetical protein MHYP_G00142280 [Metynnis hypsauchen]